MNKSYSYDIRQVSAWSDGVDDYNNIIWTYNETFHLDTLKTSAKDHRRAILVWLRNNGLALLKNGLYLDFDGDIYEVKTRTDDEPIMAFIPEF